MEWLDTFVEEQHFPFYEFLWLCMLGLWWSVILRLQKLHAMIKNSQEQMNWLCEEVSG